MALPHPLGVFAASRALNRRREDESLEELAVLPLRPAALKWLFLLPAASALNASIKPLMLGSVGAWSIACAKLASLPPADTWIAYLLTAFFFLLFISTPIFLILIFLRRFTQMSALIGWRLILSFNPLGVWALAMLIGLRVVGGILLGIIAVLTGVGVAVNYSDVLGERGTLTVLLLSVFAMLALWMQSLALGFRLPPQWAMEDDLLIAERGLQALRPRDDFAEKGRLLGMLLLLLWPWPRYNSEWRVAPHQRDLAKRWRQRNGWEG
jgi:hypothetical protein